MMLFFHSRRGKPWQINATIAALLVFYIWARFFIPDEPEEVETLSIQAVVVSDPDYVEALQQSSSFHVVKVRLPDGTHAYVTPKYEQLHQGATVDVQVTVLDDGTRRVSLPSF